MLRTLLRSAFSPLAGAVLSLALASSAAHAQTVPLFQPTSPPASLPPAALVAPPGSEVRITQLEEQLKRMETFNRALLEKYEDLAHKYDDLSKQSAGPLPRKFRTDSGQAAKEGKEKEAEEEPAYVRDMPPTKRKVETSFSNGLTWKTNDDFFELTFHNLTQADYRKFDPTGDPLHDNFVVPRQRWYFQGHVSEYANFYTVINRGYGTLDILDSWADFNIDKEHLQIRIGRMKTPFTYEYIKVAESDLIAPERSVYVGNLAPNREIGVMAHGRFFDKALEYWTGIFNGPRRSFQDFNDSKDFFAMINTRPFLHADIPFLEQLNIGGSFNGGTERNPAQPFSFRTANDQSTSAAAANVSPTFLALGNNVFENGSRAQWSGDLAYYFKSFTFLGSYQGGYQDYSIANSGTPPGAEALRLGVSEFVGVTSPKKTHLPSLGWSAAATYFLTGEEITRRRYLLQPINPFGFHNGKFGTGAIELFSRFSYLHLSSKVFTDNLTTGAPWSNTANVLDTGINWYLNNYVKITLDYQHSWFPDPVFLEAGQTTKHFELYWLRTQIFF